jgi:hypothetical protein
MLQVKPLGRDYQRHHRRVSRERRMNSMAARESTVAIITASYLASNDGFRTKMST